MARYTGPRTKKSRAFGEAIYGPDKSFERRKFPPGQHGAARRRKQRSDYAVQLTEKQKAKYTYGLLERQFRNLFEKAPKGHEQTKCLLEAYLDGFINRINRRSAWNCIQHPFIWTCFNACLHYLHPSFTITSTS